MTPNPGSTAAVALGCTCAVLDNEHGNEDLGRTRGFYIAQGCPVHNASGLINGFDNEQYVDAQKRLGRG